MLRDINQPQQAIFLHGSICMRCLDGRVAEGGMEVPGSGIRGMRCLYESLFQ